MRLAICCLILLPLATAAPLRAPSENILSFLNDAFSTATEKTEPAGATAEKEPARKPVKEQDSEDVSDAQSREVVPNNGRTEPQVPEANNGGQSRDVLNDLDSDELLPPQAAEKVKAPSRRRAGAGGDTTALTDGPYGSTEHADPNSEEGVMGTPAGTRGRRSGGRRGIAAVELMDPDSLEHGYGRPAAAGDRGDIDYDDTRELASAETRPLAPAPAKTRAFGKPRDSVPAIC